MTLLLILLLVTAVQAQPFYQYQVSSGDEIGMSSDSDFERPIDVDNSVVNQVNTSHGTDHMEECLESLQDQIDADSSYGGNGWKTELNPVINVHDGSGDEVGMSSECDSDPVLELCYDEDRPVDIVEDSSGDELGISSESESQEDLDTGFCEEGPMHGAKVPVIADLNKFLSAEAKHSPTMLKRACSIIHIKKTLKQKCKCGQKCLDKFSVKTVREMRSDFWSHPKHVRFFLLSQYAKLKISHGNFNFIRTNSGELVCSKSFLALYMVNKNSFTRAGRLNEKTVGLGKVKQTSVNTIQLTNWFEEYVGFHGDFMPHNSDVLLPYGSVKLHIYEQYKLEAAGNHVSKSTFFQVWEKHFPHVKIKKSNGFSKCTVCALLDKQMQNSLIPEKRAFIRRQRQAHNDRQMKERMYYYSKREQSRVEPKKFLSLIIDGMDQSKTNLPHFKGRLPKSVNAADLLKTHITGVISHGHGGFHTFTDFNQYPHDPNLTINIILKILKITSESNNCKLPPVLYIQADNCARENKNRYVLAFLQLLVEKRIFNEVHLSFLPVGHTHEDIDARFSLVARQLFRKDTETLEDLLQILDHPSIVDTVFDVKTWLLPNMPNFISGVSEPLHFKFERIDNQVVSFYKGTHNLEWKIAENGFLNIIPKSKPKVIKPDFSKFDEQKFIKLIKNNKSLFSKADIVTYWDDFINKIKRKKLSEKWILEELPRQTDFRRELLVEKLPDDLENLISKENKEPQITIRSKSGKENRNKKSKKSRTLAQKTKSKSARKFIHITRTVLIPFDRDIKKHIWIFILLDLFCSFCFSFVEFYLFFINYMFLTLLNELLLIIEYLWQQIISEHLGFLAVVNVITLGYVFSNFLPLGHFHFAVCRN